MPEKTENTEVVIGSQKDIKTDIEFVKNQLEYLKQYQQQLKSKSKGLSSLKVKWIGPKKEETIYKEIDRWVKCYNQLGKHLAEKNVPDATINKLQKKWGLLIFDKPTSVEQDGFKGLKKMAYNFLPFYRLMVNNGKLKLISAQIDDFLIKAELLKSLAYKIEAFYMDGL